jgi:hypothetical protein
LHGAFLPPPQRIGRTVAGDNVLVRIAVSESSRQPLYRAGGCVLIEELRARPCAARELPGRFARPKSPLYC